MDNSIADARTADVAVETATMPRFEDGCINLRELLRQLAESVVNEMMSAEADQLCEATHNSRNGYRERRLTTCVGTLTPGIPKLRVGSFFPDDVIERYQRVDRAIVAVVAETCATGTSTRKVQKVASAMGIERLSKDQAGAIAASLDAEVVRATCHLATEMLEECCPRAARILEDAEPDALAYLDLPRSHWKRLRANNVQEQTNKETRRRSKVVQVFPTVKSLERLAGSVMCDQDEKWQVSRYFSEKKMSELYDERKRPEAEGRPSKERAAELRLIAKRAIDASLELANELEAA